MTHQSGSGIENCGKYTGQRPSATKVLNLTGHLNSSASFSKDVRIGFEHPLFYYIYPWCGGAL